MVPSSVGSIPRYKQEFFGLERLHIAHGAMNWSAADLSQQMASPLQVGLLASVIGFLIKPTVNRNFKLAVPFALVR